MLEISNMLDLLGAIGERAHGVGAARAFDRAGGDRGGLRDLAADLADRGGQFLGRGGDRLNARGGLGRSRAHHGGAVIGVLRRRRHGFRGDLELVRARGHQADELADRRVEPIGECDQRAALLLLALLFRRDLLGLQHARGDRGLPQHFQRFRHPSDLVAAPGLSDRLVERTGRDALHPVLLTFEPSDDVAGDQPGQQTEQHQETAADQAEAQHQRVLVGVDVVDIEPIGHGDVPRREAAGIGHLPQRDGLAGTGKVIARYAAFRALSGGRHLDVGDDEAAGVLGAGRPALDLGIGEVQQARGVGLVDDRVALVAVEGHAPAAQAKLGLGFRKRHLAGRDFVLQRLRHADHHVDRRAHLGDAVLDHAALAERSRHSHGREHRERCENHHARELGANLQSAKQVHCSDPNENNGLRFGIRKLLTNLEIAAAQTTRRLQARNRCVQLRSAGTTKNGIMPRITLISANAITGS
jgi:hypothetical protein